MARNKKSWTGWLVMGLIAVVATVFKESWLPKAKSLPLVGDGIAALEDIADKSQA